MSNIQMVGNSILLLLICFLINSCSNAPLGVNRSQEINDNFQIPNTANNLQEIKNQNRLPVIEIWQELDGSVPIRGKSLYFKLYDDGIVEFDYQLRKENESGKSPRYTYSIEKILLPKFLKKILVDLDYFQMN
ncbi:MAG: hypothetical protein IPK58_11705 [Acidobacteria bacterium]|nr:hypothetical protein [Acidobacteriota bacterium]